MNPQKRIGRPAIVKQLKERCNLTQEDAEAVYHAVISEICGALFRWERVILPGVGRLMLVRRKPRTFVRPGTRDVVPPRATSKIAFRTANDLKRAL